MNAKHRALAEYLENRLDKRLDEFDQRFDMRLRVQSKDIFTYMDRRFDEVKNEFKEVIDGLMYSLTMSIEKMINKMMKLRIMRNESVFLRLNIV